MTHRDVVAAAVTLMETTGTAPGWLGCRLDEAVVAVVKPSGWRHSDEAVLRSARLTTEDGGGRPVIGQGIVMGSGSLETVRVSVAVLLGTVSEMNGTYIYIKIFRVFSKTSKVAQLVITIRSGGI